MIADQYRVQKISLYKHSLIITNIIDLKDAKIIYITEPSNGQE